MKTSQELEQIKEKNTDLNKKFAELNEDELKQVAGGSPYGLGEEDQNVENSDLSKWAEGIRARNN